MKKITKQLSGLAKSKGLTIVELLISLAISSLLMAGMVTMVASNSAVFRENEQNAESGENLRYSLDVLMRNVIMAGFMGNTQPINVYASQDLKNKTANLFNGNEATRKFVDPANFNNYIWYGNLKETGLKKFASKNIDGLVIKQAVPGALPLSYDSGTNPHRLYILANPFTAEVYSSGASASQKPTKEAVHKVASNNSSPLVMPVGSKIPGGKLYQYQTYIYTIENDASGVPSLIQYSLIPNTAGSVLNSFSFRGETLVENIQSFDLQFGVDTDGDSVLDQYKNAGNVSDSEWGDVRSLTVKVNGVDGHHSLASSVVLRNLAIQTGAG